MHYFHVRIKPKSNPDKIETALDLQLEELEGRFLEPYRQGRSVVINGKTIVVSDLHRI